MIYVDGRVGSRDLAEPLRKRGLAVEVTQLEYGDASFIGNGAEGPIPIGIEIKTIGDLLGCIADKRFAGHQLPGLKDSFACVYLLIEGIWSEGKQGELLVNGRPVSWGKRGWQYAQVDGFVTSMQERARIHVWRTATRHETVAFVHGRYSWWTSKEYDEHDSHLALHTTQVPVLRKPSTAEGWRRLRRMQVAAQLPGIGAGRAEKVADRFASIREMVNAPIENWLAIEGIGKKTAEEVQRAVS